MKTSPSNGSNTGKVDFNAMKNQILVQISVKADLIPVSRLSISALWIVFFLAQMLIPAQAVDIRFQEPIIGSKGYHLGSYGGGAYWISDGRTNSMFIVSDEGVIVIDAPPSYADKIPDAIREVTEQPVKYFIYSHYHKDHTGGAAIFGDEVIRVGHALTAKELRRVNDPNRPVPSLTFDEAYTIKLGGQEVELSYPGLQHTPGNIIIYLPKQQVLMLVDIIYPDLVPFARLGLAAHTPGFIEVIEKAKENNFKYFQGGHLARPGTRQEYLVVQEYVLDLRNSALTAMKNIRPPLSLKPSDNLVSDPYYSMHAYFEAVSEACAQIVIEKWGGRLKGARSFSKSHCWTVILDSRTN